MPANLPPDYFAAEKRYREARTPKEKIEALREMLAVMPKHKGTEHLQGDLKRRIARHLEEAKKKPKIGKAAAPDYIEKEGAGQLALVGLPNSGKSSILAAVTNAHPQVADYPFSTFRPLAGMMPYQDIQIQLVDLPPISEEYTESWVYNIIRCADLAVLVVDLGASQPEEQVLSLVRMLERVNIRLSKSSGERADGLSVITKKAVVVGNKADAGGAKFRADRLVESRGIREGFAIQFISAKTGANLGEMKEFFFNGLEILRIYTKAPGKKSDLEKPYILPKGSTVLDVAKAIHKDFVERFRFARIWGSEKYDGQMVQRDHRVEDGDVIEIHI
ncbi:TGS domain-containing protein [candidate division KSB1 bacterium]|nr:TGS domain-containing protein [candidate division KSB1 bacterium]